MQTIFFNYYIPNMQKQNEIKTCSWIFNQNKFFALFNKIFTWFNLSH
jgi:hypothetical protein